MAQKPLGLLIFEVARSHSHHTR